MTEDKNDKSEKVDMVFGVDSPDWQLECAVFNQRGARLLQTGHLADVKFLVGPERVLVTGHRLILAMASPLFEIMFYGSMPEKGDYVKIMDVTPDAFRNMLHFIYTDEAPLNSFDSVCELYRGAHMYRLPHLASKCMEYLVSNIAPEHATRAYDLAYVYDEKTLMEKAVEFIIGSTKTAISSKSFDDAELVTVEKIFSFEPLNIDSEIDLLDATKRYALSLKRKLHLDMENTKQESQKNPNDNDNDSDADYDKKDEDVVYVYNEDIANLLRSVIQQIRFLTLSPKEFAESTSSSMLLTQDECLSIMMNISSPYTSRPMPSGFSTCRTPRNRDRPEGIIEATLKDLSKMNTFDGETFYIRNLPWKIWAKKSVNNNQYYLGFYVMCNWQSTGNCTCEAECRFRLLSSEPDGVPLEKVITQTFTGASNTHGFELFLLWTELIKPENKYYFNDSVKLQAHIKAKIPIWK